MITYLFAILEALGMASVSCAQESGRVVISGQNSGTSNKTGLHDGARAEHRASGSGFLALLLLLHLLGGGLLWDLNLWHLNLLDGLSALALAYHTQDFLLHWQNLLSDLTEGLDNLAHLLDDWLDDLVDDTVGLLLGSSGLGHTALTRNVHLLNADWARARSELNNDGSQVGLDDDDLGSDYIFANGHFDHFLGTRGDHGSSDGPNLDWGSWLVGRLHKLRATLRVTGWWVGRSGGMLGNMSCDGSSVFAEGRHKAVSLDGTLEGTLVFCGGKTDQYKNYCAKLEHDDLDYDRTM
jgi:hypothetical protein